MGSFLPEGRREEARIALETVRDVTSQIRLQQDGRSTSYDEMRSKLKHQIDLYHAKSDSAQAEGPCQGQELEAGPGATGATQAQLPEDALKEELEQAQDRKWLSSGAGQQPEAGRSAGACRPGDAGGGGPGGGSGIFRRRCRGGIRPNGRRNSWMNWSKKGAQAGRNS